jgi:uncharacterized protein (TIGR02246 family)
MAAGASGRNGSIAATTAMAGMVESGHCDRYRPKRIALRILLRIDRMTSALRLSRMWMLFLMAMPSAAVAESRSRTLAPRAAYDLQLKRLEAFFQSRTQDTIALRSIYTRDAILVEADGNIIRGRDAIAEHFKQILASGAVASFKVTTDIFRTQGSISYAGGCEDIEEHGAKENRHSQNRFLSLLRRDADAVWRFDYIMEVRPHDQARACLPVR